MRLKNLLKRISRYDYGEAVLLLFILIKTLKGVIEMNFKKISNPDIYVKTILMLCPIWIFNDVVGMYPFYVLLIDIIACFSFTYFAYHIFFVKAKNFKYYLKFGNVGMIYSMIIISETLFLGNELPIRVYMTSMISCLIISVMSIVLSSSTYED